jgi:Putative Ig domain
MPNIPCPYHESCVDPADPRANTSAEAPDSDFFFGYNSWWAGFPPLDSIWDSVGCIAQCVSTVSQLDADICAANQQLICSYTDGGGNGGINDGTGWIDPRTGRSYDPAFNDPETCNVKCPDGLNFSYTQPAGTIEAFSRTQADQVALQVACQKARQHRVCLSALSQTEACVGSRFSGTIIATGNTVSANNNTWQNPGGGLPPGVTMAFGIGGGTMTLSGVATVSGFYTFTISVLTPSGDFMSKTFSICVVDITPAQLPDCTIGVPYTAQLMATACANQTQSWQVISGSLPPGLVLNEQTGVISGTPTGPVGTVKFTTQFQDAAS